MSQKAFLIEAVSGKDILGYEPIASQIAEGLHVASINGFNKDGKSMCAVLLSEEGSSGGGGSDGESSGSDSGSDTLAPPVFSPYSSLAGGYSFDNSIEVTITAEDADAIVYNITGLNDGEGWEEYEEPITLTASTTIFARAVKDNGDDLPTFGSIVAAYYEKT